MPPPLRAWVKNVSSPADMVFSSGTGNAWAEPLEDGAYESTEFFEACVMSDTITDISSHHWCISSVN